ncbi:hypothetical protein [Methanogenium sp. MK-MG]|uniref:hypothetical protein n=1 Tax=Methanogenium sp. MK-MG TaxID=2599926 RepID=UPI0013ED0C89|nr:hypothetical protein [Methanogenium sp. MK-MG]KAF1074821.1 hypothetical protein MKMG_01872 [Methanogenium sp. MK-MG]
MTKTYCFVGDILGFKNIIKNSKDDERDKRVTDWIKIIEDSSPSYNLDHIEFISDTVFIGAENTIEGLGNLLKYSKYLMETALENYYPIQGAIGYGDISWGGEITYGEPISDAYTHSQNQNWIGTSVLPNTPYIDHFYDFDLLVSYPTPLKTGFVRPNPCVCWDIPPFGNLTKKLTGGRLMKNGDHVNWNIMNKIQNTILFSDYLKIIKNIENEADPSKLNSFSPLQLIERFIDQKMSEI